MRRACKRTPAAQDQRADVRDEMSKHWDAKRQGNARPNQLLLPLHVEPSPRVVIIPLPEDLNSDPADTDAGPSPHRRSVNSAVAAQASRRRGRYTGPMFFALLASAPFLALAAFIGIAAQTPDEKFASSIQVAIPAVETSSAALPAARGQPPAENAATGGPLPSSRQPMLYSATRVATHVPGCAATHRLKTAAPRSPERRSLSADELARLDTVVINPGRLHKRKVTARRPELEVAKRPRDPALIDPVSARSTLEGVDPSRSKWPVRQFLQSGWTASVAQRLGADNLALLGNKSLAFVVAYIERPRRLVDAYSCEHLLGSVPGPAADAQEADPGISGSTATSECFPTPDHGAFNRYRWPALLTSLFTAR